MNDERKNTRSKLKGIPKISTFNDLLEQATLSDEEKEILKLHYIQNKNLGYIADMLGYSEAAIKKKHSKILKKISKIIWASNFV